MEENSLQIFGVFPPVSSICVSNLWQYGLAFVWFKIIFFYKIEKKCDRKPILIDVRSKLKKKTQLNDEHPISMVHVHNNNKSNNNKYREAFKYFSIIIITKIQIIIVYCTFKCKIYIKSRLIFCGFDGRDFLYVCVP